MSPMCEVLKRCQIFMAQHQISGIASRKFALRIFLPVKYPRYILQLNCVLK